jgi:Ca-activated chloride channel homolog
MQYFYGEHDGDEFPTPDKLFSADQLSQFILQYGEQALQAMQEMLESGKEGPISDALEQMLQDGLIDKGAGGKLRLTPRAVTKMQQKALLEVFGNLRQGQRDGHEKVTSGPQGARIESTKPYVYGDPLSDIDLHQSLRNALSRQGISADGSIRFGERDLESFQHEGTASCSTVLLLDMSGSMMRYGRFMSAKKVALAMLALIRQRFPQDTIDFVGFYSGANQIPEAALPLTMPKPVTVYDHSVRLKVPLAQLGKAPQHFTNLHMGLQLARKILRKRSGENKQIFVITDGQPTAHVEGDFVHLIYPPDHRSAVATLKEAVTAAREGCRISTFALIEDYWGMDWVGFVDQLTKLTKGVAFYTSSGELSNCIMESYLSGRRKKTAIG